MVFKFSCAGESATRITLRVEFFFLLFCSFRFGFDFTSENTDFTVHATRASTIKSCASG